MGKLIDRLAVVSNAFPRHSFEYVLNNMQRLEIKNMCLWGGVPHFFGGRAEISEIKEMERKISAADISVISYMPEINAYGYNTASCDSDVRKTAVEYLKKNIDISEIIGVDTMIVSYGWYLLDESATEADKLALDSFGQIYDYAKSKKIKIALRSNTNLLPNIGKIYKLKTIYPNLEYNPDITTIYTLGNKIEKEMLSSIRINQINISDGIHSQPGVHLCAGDGELSLKEIIEEISLSGFSGNYALELNNRKYFMDPVNAIEKTIMEIL